MPPSWKHSGSDCIGLWVSWFSWRCPWLLKRSWTRWSLKVFSKWSFDSMILSLAIKYKVSNFLMMHLRVRSMSLRLAKEEPGPTQVEMGGEATPAWTARIFLMPVVQTQLLSLSIWPKHTVEKETPHWATCSESLTELPQSIAKSLLWDSRYD